MTKAFLGCQCLTLVVKTHRHTHWCLWRTVSEPWSQKQYWILFCWICGVIWIQLVQFPHLLSMAFSTLYICVYIDLSKREARTKSCPRQDEEGTCWNDVPLQTTTMQPGATDTKPNEWYCCAIALFVRS